LHWENESSLSSPRFCNLNSDNQSTDNSKHVDQKNNQLQGAQGVFSFGPGNFDQKNNNQIPNDIPNSQSRSNEDEEIDDLTKFRIFTNNKNLNCTSNNQSCVYENIDNIEEWDESHSK
jgi:hypothetical protein